MTGIIFALIAAVATALSHVLAKDSVHKQDVSAFLIVRTAAAAGVLAIIFVIRNGFTELRAMSPGLVWLLIGMGLFCPFAVNIIYFTALKRLRVNVATPIFQSYPAMAFVFGLVFLNITFAVTNCLGVMAVVSGTAAFCLLRSGKGEHEKTDVRGLLLVLLSALLMAIATVLWKVLQTKASALVICFLGTGAATGALLAGHAGRFQAIRWGGAATNLRTALSGILAFGIANLLSIGAMKALSPAVVYAIVSSSVLWVGVLAFFMLREKWTPAQIAAAAFVFVGIGVLGFGQ